MLLKRPFSVYNEKVQTLLKFYWYLIWVINFFTLFKAYKPNKSDSCLFFKKLGVVAVLERFLLTL